VLVISTAGSAHAMGHITTHQVGFEKVLRQRIFLCQLHSLLTKKRLNLVKEI